MTSTEEGKISGEIIVANRCAVEYIHTKWREGDERPINILFEEAKATVPRAAKAVSLETYNGIKESQISWT
jgi:hypothetical protein